MYYYRILINGTGQQSEIATTEPITEESFEKEWLITAKGSMFRPSMILVVYMSTKEKYEAAMKHDEEVKIKVEDKPEPINLAEEVKAILGALKKHCTDRTCNRCQLYEGVKQKCKVAINNDAPQVWGCEIAKEEEK